MGELCQNPRISPVIIWTTSRGNFLQDFEKYAARMRTSLYRGIRWRPGVNGLRIFEIPERALGVWLGTFNTAEQAAKAYDAGAKIIRGKKAKLNFADDSCSVKMDSSTEASGKKIKSCTQNPDLLLECFNINSKVEFSYSPMPDLLEG